MIQFLRSLTPKTRILLALILGGIVIFLFWVTLFGFLSARHSIEQVNQYDVAIGLARKTNADFQLAISKGKNFVILKDETNKKLVQEYFDKSKATFEKLSALEKDPQGKELLYRLGAGLKNVEFSLGILTSAAKKGDSADKLYHRYLQDITIDFDNSSQAYVDFLDGKVRAAQARTASETLMDLLFAVAGALLGLLGMGLSYSIARNLNEALSNETASQERYRMLSEVAEEAIMVHDQGVIVEANPTLARLLGYSLTDVIGKHVSLFMDAPSIEATRERLQKGYPERSYELKARRKDGSTFPLLVHGRDIEYHGRKMRLSCGWDMTELKKTEEALRASDERFKRFAAVTKEGIYIHDEGVIVDANETLAQMVGYPIQELIGQREIFLRQSQRVEQLKKFESEGFPETPYELEAVRKDGSGFPVEVHGRSFKLNGRSLRVVSIWDIRERKKAEQALSESQERFERFAEVTKEGIMIHQNGVIVDVNAALAQMTGFALRELVGTDGAMVLTSESKAKVDEFRKNGYPQEPYEIVLRTKEGALLPVEVHGRDFEYEGMRMRVASFWDLTERKKAEQALKESEDRFKSFARIAKEGIFIHDDGVLVDANESLVRMTGFSLEELIGHTDVFFHKPTARELIAKYKVEGYPQSPYEVIIRRKDGSLFPAEVEGSDFNWKGKKLRVVTLWDITERKKAEEALRVSEEKFRNLIENSHDIIVVVGEDRVVTYMSSSVKRVLGYDPTERIGQTFAPIMHPDDLERMRGEFKKLLMTHGAPVTVEFRLLHKDGSWRHCQSVGINLLANPAVRALIYNIRDITEKKRAEEALYASEKKFRALIDNSHDVISITGPDMRMTYISPSVKRVLGYEPEERIGLGYAQIMHPEDLERIRGEFATLVSRPGSSWTVQFRLRHKDGSWRNVESTGTNLLEEPAVNGIVYNLKDITERMEAEGALRKSEENFRNLIEKSPDAVLVTQDNTVVYANSKLISLLGYDEKEELLGHPSLSIVHHGDRKAVAERVQTLMGGGRTYPQEIRLIRRDGAEFPAEAASITIQFLGGRAIMVNFRDITARKQAEAAARENQERYRSLVESMPDSVMVHDEETILYVNSSAVKTFGAKSEEDLVGKPFWMVVPPEFRDTVRARIRAIVERGAVNELAERKLKRLDGNLIDVLVTSVPFNDKGRRVVLAIFLDISALKEAERKAQKYQRLAVLGEMAAGLAHEIRNPAAAISAQAQYILKKTEKGSPPYDQLKDIIAQCDRLDTLVRDTLDYSPEKKFEERTQIPAKDLFQKALWLAQTQFGPSHARVQVILDVNPDLPPLWVHPTRMERVLVNLILNAFQAMPPEGGHLVLRAERQENRAILRVEDDGKGISEQEMSRLFEPFFTSRKMGSGLGLSICQKIVEEHGGQIRVERVEPHGAAFTLQIPFDKEKTL